MRALFRFLVGTIAAFPVLASAQSVLPGRSTPPRGELVDATGKAMGPLLVLTTSDGNRFAGGDPYVLVKVSGQIAAIRLGKADVPPNGMRAMSDLSDYPPLAEGLVHFDGIGCTGSAYVMPRGGVFEIALGRSALIVDVTRGSAPYLYVGQVVADVPFTSVSFLSDSGVCTAATPAAPRSGTPLLTVIDFSSLFVAPYRLR